MNRYEADKTPQQIAQECCDVLVNEYAFDPIYASDCLGQVMVQYVLEQYRYRHGSPRTDRLRKLHALCELGQFQEQGRALLDLSRFAPKAVGLVRALLQSSPHPDSEVFESFLETLLSRFRFDSYTRRTYIEPILQMVGFHGQGSLYAPFCGTGGFVIAAVKAFHRRIQRDHPEWSADKVAQRIYEWSSQHLFATEINEATAHIARLNLWLHGLDPSRVVTLNALDLHAVRSTPGYPTGGASFVLANPCVAGYEGTEDILKQFTLGGPRIDATGKVTPCPREALAIEAMLACASDGAVLGIVVPLGVLNTQAFGAIRQYIRERAQVLAVIELKPWSRLSSNPGVRMAYLFLRKGNADTEHSIFMKHAGSQGDPSDFGDTVEAYRSLDANFLVRSDAVRDRLDPGFYQPRHRSALELLEGEDVRRLSDLGEFRTTRYNPRAHPGPGDTFLLIESSSVDAEALTIHPRVVTPDECRYPSLRRVEADDILISRRHPHRGVVVQVPREFDGAYAVTEFSILRLYQSYGTEYGTEYILGMLRSQEFVQLMVAHATGETASRIAETKLKTLGIPIPPNHVELGSRFKTQRDRIRCLRAKIERIERETARLATDVIEESRQKSRSMRGDDPCLDEPAQP